MNTSGFKSPTAPGRPASTRLQAARERLSSRLSGASLRSPAGVVAGLILFFVALSAWWIAVDKRVPDFDSGKHLAIAYYYFDAFQHGHALGWFTSYQNYPPFVHVVGAAAVRLTGVGVVGPIVAENVVFVPLLALGCYWTGSVAYDRRAGALAAAFALGTPIIMSQFHVFMTDGPLTAMAAVSVGCVLKSRRFESLGWSLAAGVAIGLGLMTKNTFVLFVAGFVAVAILRGGWRNWRGLLLTLGVAAALAVPWHIEHYDSLRGYTQGAVGGSKIVGTTAVAGGGRWTIENFASYIWNLLNNQLYLPLFLLFVGGTAWAIKRYVTAPRKDDYTPELVVGGFVGYFATTMISTFDGRYTLPLLVYLAVLGTGWIAMARWRLRRAGTIALAAIFVLNTATVSFGAWHPTRIVLPGGHDPDVIGRRLVTLVSNGFIEAGPVMKDNRTLEALRAARRDGVPRVGFGAADVVTFNGAGLNVYARMAGIGISPTYDPRVLKPDEVFMFRKQLQPGDPKPCYRLEDGSNGVWFVKWKGAAKRRADKPTLPFNLLGWFEHLKEYDLYCPLR
jgi:4-amino-4-deoxy-L-arabinose transferase-like glycosyltransferase